MAAYKTTIALAEQPELGNKGLVLIVKEGKHINGHLMVGKASLFWFEKNAKKKARRMSWSDLTKAFEKRAEIKVTRPQIR